MSADAIRLRPPVPQDLEVLYRISLVTGDGGKDATHLHRDGNLIGHIYSAPYAMLAPETAFVAEDGQGIAGYLVGVHDTRAFEAELERRWWPALRARYPMPPGDPAAWDADQRRISQIHHPRLAPDALVEAYPAHIHMNLLPRCQGRGIGSRLLAAWLDQARAAGVTHVHLGANADNHAGIAFWIARGFAPLGPPLVPATDRPTWFGRAV